MNKIFIELPEKLRTALDREANRLDLTVDALVAGLVKKFLQKQSVDVEESASETLASERRTTARQKIDQLAILYFKTDDGRYGLYKTGDLKDLSPGGALLECSTSVSNENFFCIGVELELIFQFKDVQQALYLPCKVNRVNQARTKTILGVAFTDTDDEHYKTLLEYLR